MTTAEKIVKKLILDEIDKTLTPELKNRLDTRNKEFTDKVDKILEDFRDEVLNQIQSHEKSFPHDENETVRKDMDDRVDFANNRIDRIIEDFRGEIADEFQSQKTESLKDYQDLLKRVERSTTQTIEQIDLVAKDIDENIKKNEVKSKEKESALSKTIKAKNESLIKRISDTAKKSQKELRVQEDKLKKAIPTKQMPDELAKILISGDMALFPGGHPKAGAQMHVHPLSPGGGEIVQLYHLAIRTEIANYTAGSTDQVILCNGTFTVTLPTPATGKFYYIKNISTGIITVATVGAETIDAENTQTIYEHDDMMVVTEGTNWHIT